MATISIDDLPARHELGQQAMSRIRGASGAPWVFGWIVPYTGASQSREPVINFYQINNYADQIINQYQTVSVSNSAGNSTLNVKVDESSLNNRL
jgi:hypothetical protein